MFAPILFSIILLFSVILNLNHKLQIKAAAKLHFLRIMCKNKVLYYEKSIKYLINKEFLAKNVAIFFSIFSLLLNLD